MPDFFAWSKILPLLFYPMPLLLVLLFILVGKIRDRSWKWLTRLVIALFWTLSTPLVADWCSRWESPRLSRADLPAVSDVAVVLGGLSSQDVSNKEHLEFNQASERLTEAVQLYKEGRAKALLITSGSDSLWDPTLKEAPGLAAWAVSMGVPADRVFVEDQSRNTLENAVLSLKIVEEHGWRSVVLVTSAVHMPRSSAIFRKQGYSENGRTLALWPVDTQQSGADFPFLLLPHPHSLDVTYKVLKEVVGYGVYAVQGYL